MIVSGNQVIIWKEAVCTYLKVLSRYYSGDTEKKLHKTRRDWKLLPLEYVYIVTPARTFY
jgi:hypothetical protein